MTQKAAREFTTSLGDNGGRSSSKSLVQLLALLAGSTGALNPRIKLPSPTICPELASGLEKKEKIARNEVFKRILLQGEFPDSCTPVVHRDYILRKPDEEAEALLREHGLITIKKRKKKNFSITY